MGCKQCGASCQGEYCQFHGQEQSREGHWQNGLDDGGLPEEDDLAFLGPDVHKCDPCDRVFGSLQALANHECVIDSLDDDRLDTTDAGAATVVRGPTPGAQARWDAGREHAQHGGGSR